MRVVSLVKAPAETIVQTIDLGGRALGVGATVVTPRGLAAETAPVVADPVLDKGNVALSLSGGTDGEVYAVEVVAMLDGGEERELPIELAVIDGAWTMPDGGAPMLSVAEFVSRVGRDQVLLLADLGDGRIDKGLVIGALVDAQAQVEANIAGRYALPFEQVPTMVQSIVKDLALAGLYVDELPENVAEKRKIALRNLEAMRKGDLKLGADARPQTKAPADPVRFRAGERAYPDGLKDYSWR